MTRKKAGELAARFSEAADQNGDPKKPITPAASAPADQKTPKAAVKTAALDGVKIISKKVASTANTPPKLIGDAVQNAKNKLIPTKVVKTVPVKVAAESTKNKITAPRVDAFSKTTKIQTGSVRPPPVITFGAPVVRRAKPRRTKVAIRLASAPSKAALKLNWLALKDRYGDAMRGLTPRYETLGTRTNRRYRLIAGPVDSAARAVSLCDNLNAGNIPCTVSALTGKPL